MEILGHEFYVDKEVAPSFIEFKCNKCNLLVWAWKRSSNFIYDEIYIGSIILTITCDEFIIKKLLE